MRRSAFVLATSLVAVFLFASVALGGQIVRVGKRVNGTTVALHRGDTLVVSLAGNASTGYSWRVRALDRSVVKPTGSTYVQRKTTPPKVGVGGTYVLRFRALAQGKTRLKLVYVRSGNTTAPPARTFVLSVVVKSAP
jgi:inhibitor of cysteine peptidase